MPWINQEMHWSDEMFRIFGFTPGQFAPNFGTLIEAIHPEDVPLVGQAMQRSTLAKETSVELEHRVLRPDGEVRVVQAHVETVFGEDGEPQRRFGTVLDITERKRMEEELQRSERDLAAAQRIAHLGNWAFDILRNEARWSEEMYWLFGLTPRETPLTYKEFFDYVHPEDREKVRRAVRNALYGSEDSQSLLYRIIREDGEMRFLDAQYEIIRDASGRAVSLIGTALDVTERERVEAELAYQASHDLLTGLPNRAMFMGLLQQALERARLSERGFALLFLDLDNFKVINDSLGHQTGDELLAAVARRFERFLRSNYTVARFEGDEFTILLEDVTDIRGANRMSERIMQLFGHPFSTWKGDFSVTCSAGVVLWTPSYLSPESLLRDADTAMYRAKSGGKSRYAIFEPNMNVMAVERMQLERDLRVALERDEFVIHYQPKVLPGNGKLTGVEALVRWTHPERGLVDPLNFIPVAEETGLIVTLGHWVLREACRQMREWQERYPSDPPLVVSVNVSARQFHSSRLVAEVEEILQETGLEPGCLALEITESMIQDDVEVAIETLEELRRLGVGLEIDDFGTGYSSFSYLKRFPMDTLKIDKSFVSGLGGGVEDAAIARAIVNVAHTLGLKATAEGVETREQLEQLREIGCDQAQGYFFSRPLDRVAVASFIETGALQLEARVQGQAP